MIRSPKTSFLLYLIKINVKIIPTLGDNMKKLDVLYTSNTKYIDLMCASILSLIENGNIENLNIHIITSEYKIEDYKKIDMLLEPFTNVKVTFYQLDKYDIEKYKIPSWRGNQVANARLFFQDIMEDKICNIENLLYLDSDTIVVDSLDILNLYFNNLVSAVSDICLKEYYKKFPNLKKYYNTGVILFNIEKWFQEDCQYRLVETIKSNKVELTYPDQDIFNLTFSNEITSLPSCFNASPFSFVGNKTYQKLFFNGKYRDINFIESEITKNNPKILHGISMAGIRPWNKNHVHPFNKIFMDYIKRIHIDFEKEDISIKRKILSINPTIFYNLFILKMYTKKEILEDILDIKTYEKKKRIK